MNNSKAPVDTPILRAESLAAWREGEQFLVHARRQADGMRTQAEAAAQALREQAWQQGYEEGKQAGNEEAAALVFRIAEEREAYLHGLESRLAHVIDFAVKKILDSFDHQVLVTHVTLLAMRALRGPGSYTLRVSPGMASKLDASGALSSIRGVTLCESDALQDDQCWLDTPAGTIALTAHEQWDRIFKAMQPAAKDGE